VSQLTKILGNCKNRQLSLGGAGVLKGKRWQAALEKTLLMLLLVFVSQTLILFYVNFFYFIFVQCLFSKGYERVFFLIILF
jgi:hypothetical protein